jgi:glycosyltransferase involved in cell wall biosynthesis
MDTDSHNHMAKADRGGGDVPRSRVCMLVFNNFTNDSRVLKQAETLLGNGYSVTEMARLDGVTETVEERNGVQVNRLEVTPCYGVYFQSIKWTASCLLLFGMVEILFCPRLYSFLQINKFYVYLLMCAFAVCAIVFRKPLATIIRVLQKKVAWVAGTVLLPFRRQFCFLSYYRKVWEKTKHKRFDVYHAHDLNTLPAAWLCARRDHAKLVYDSHELYVERNRKEKAHWLWKFYLRKLEGFLVRRCDAVYTVNQSLAAEMARRYRISEPGVIMNAPACFSKFEHAENNMQLREALSIAPDYKILLYVGSITFNRGLEALIKSLVHLPDCYLVFMGYGVDAFKQGLQALAEGYGVADRFAFYGPVATDQVIHYAAGADLGVAPIANACLSYYYCSPNKLFEYMNAGLPVIASNFPELEKTVLGHEIGYTFDPESPEDIAKAARFILDDPEKARAMHDNALQAASLYNWGNESKKLLEIYERMQLAS